ncbi:MAG: AI-2E family transporter [Pseudobutyrivibrio sp.]|nr:AI-2E family transporter [Pseudobutyrivibrio sp.]
MPESNEEKRNSRHEFKIAGLVVLCACIIILFYFTVLRYAGLRAGWARLCKVFEPIIQGVVMAFLINPVMKGIEKHIYRPIRRHSKSDKTAFKTTRTIAAILGMIIFIGIISLFAITVIPQLIDTITYLVNNIETQIAAILDWCNLITGGRYEQNLMAAKNSELEEALGEALELVRKYLDYDQDELISMVTSSVIGLGKSIFNLFIGLFVAIYLLIDKEKFKGQFKKLICGLCSATHANIILDISRRTGEIFYGFIIGKIIDSIIIGFICYFCCLIMKMPYAVLVSVIVGVTNIIPVFGPYIGAIPTVIIIFLTEPMKGIYFLIFVIVLQQFDGNWLGPKILGNSTGLSSFWVVFAVVVGGGLFGVPGMIIGVPAIGVISYAITRYSKYLLRKKGLPESTSVYTRLISIDTKTNTLNLRSEEEEVEKRTAILGKANQDETKK